VIAQQWKSPTVTQPSAVSSRHSSSFPMTPDRVQRDSLDVIHSFWAYQLEVKADANPLENNVAFTKTEQLGALKFAAANCAGSGTERCSTPARSSRSRHS